QLQATGEPAGPASRADPAARRPRRRLRRIVGLGVGIAQILPASRVFSGVRIAGEEPVVLAVGPWDGEALEEVQQGVSPDLVEAARVTGVFDPVGDGPDAGGRGSG